MATVVVVATVVIVVAVIVVLARQGSVGKLSEERSVPERRADDQSGPGGPSTPQGSGDQWSDVMERPAGAGRGGSVPCPTPRSHPWLVPPTRPKPTQPRGRQPLRPCRHRRMAAGCRSRVAGAHDEPGPNTPRTTRWTAPPRSKAHDWAAPDQIGVTLLGRLRHGSPAHACLGVALGERHRGETLAPGRVG